MAVPPDPVVAPAAVSIDSGHTLTVWPLESRSQAGRVWADALEDLAEEEATGDWSYASPVWAYHGGRRVARGSRWGWRFVFPVRQG
jgi:hypothetical protein